MEENTDPVIRVRRFVKEQLLTLGCTIHLSESNQNQNTLQPWLHFDLTGFNKCADRQVALILKNRDADPGISYAELQFGKTKKSELEEATHDILDTDMCVAQRAGSASVCIKVPRLDHFSEPEPQKLAIQDGLKAADRLYVFFEQHRSLIAESLSA